MVAGIHAQGTHIPIELAGDSSDFGPSGFARRLAEEPRNGLYSRPGKRPLQIGHDNQHPHGLHLTHYPFYAQLVMLCQADQVSIDIYPVALHLRDGE
jgi:hypothetical protein